MSAVVDPAAPDVPDQEDPDRAHATAKDREAASARNVRIREDPAAMPIDEAIMTTAAATRITVVQNVAAAMHITIAVAIITATVAITVTATIATATITKMATATNAIMATTTKKMASAADRLVVTNTTKNRVTRKRRFRFSFLVGS